MPLAVDLFFLGLDDCVLMPCLNTPMARIATLLHGLAWAMVGCILIIPVQVLGDDLPVQIGEFPEQIQPLLQSHCADCHGSTEQEGGVSFARIKSGEDLLRWRSLWKRSLQRIEAGEMPPEGAKPLLPEDRKKLVNWMRFASEYIHCSEPERRDPGPAPFRRLTRTEFNNTVRDLLSLNLDVGSAVGMAEDGGGDSFENLAAGLPLTQSLLEKYFAAADKSVDAVFAQDGNGERARKALFIVLPDDKTTPKDAAKKILTRLARRAYHRAPTPEDQDRLLHFFDQAIEKGESFEKAIQAAVKPALLSPRFLFRIEEDRTGEKGETGANVDDFELAVRLSYFLWSSMPDDELLRVAEEQDLQDPVVLREQVKRMLADRRAYALTGNFAAQWLQLRKLDRARPSTEFFPTFTGQLKQAMREEVLTFWDKLRIEDRSILELLDADYTYVNETLATHYGIPDVKGGEFRRVTLRQEDHRGGLLGMGGVLALTSHTFRTSPTQRGKYVLEVVLGEPPPPPPPNVSALPEVRPGEKKEVRSLRDQLAQHAVQASCAGCHRKIDPLGFALDNYNAIGIWRENSPEVQLDVSGTLPSGETFQGVGGLKQVLQKRQDDFARNLVEKLLVYAIGRELEYFDDCAVREAATSLKAHDYRFSTLVEEVVLSVPFRKRRTASVEESK